MKKILVAILSVFYLLSTSGFTVYEHYCMGELANASLSDNTSDDGSCSKCGMEKKEGTGNDCCQDEHKFVKTDDQNTGVKLVVNKSLIALADLLSYLTYDNTLHSSFGTDINTGLPHAPPQADIYKHPIFIRVQSLLI